MRRFWLTVVPRILINSNKIYAINQNGYCYIQNSFIHHNLFRIKKGGHHRTALTHLLTNSQYHTVTGSTGFKAPTPLKEALTDTICPLSDLIDKEVIITLPV